MKCKFCNAELPEGISFCPMCAKSLADTEEIALPNPYKRKIISITNIAAAAPPITAFFFL